MEMSIRVLSNELISQIAAGEVIERPASAVKELVENAFDAGATQISVEIEEGGLRLIRVIDNGRGIPAGQLRLAFERHATSKLTGLDDLFRIQSLGFRGEALASIASIARVQAYSHVEGADAGAELELDASREIRFDEKGGPVGTDIKVLGLFQHTPARKKYMKTERTEANHIFEMLARLALAHPEVGMRFQRDEKEVFSLPSKQSLKERVRSLYGSQTANALIPVQFHQSNLVINGFVGKPELARSSKKYQFILVNGRPIDSRLIQRAVKDAFHSLLMHEKHPWFLLDIQIDPQLVDVNVHPRKLEVKFVNQQEVFRAVRGSVHHALQGNLLSPAFVAAAAPAATAPVPASIPLPEREAAPVRNFAPAHLPVQIREMKSTFNVQGTVLRPVAQIAHSYIVAESEEGLVLIDQHAAHERVRYAQLMEALEKETPLLQPLLTPLEMDLGVDAARLLEEYMKDFVSLGYEIESFGGNTFLVRSVPAGLTKRDPEKVLRDILTDLSNEWKNNHVKDLREELLTMTACRGAIKFGDPLSLPEMQALLEDMETTKHCTHCPHGRPALLTFSFDQLETLFKRKNF